MIIRLNDKEIKNIRTALKMSLYGNQEDLQDMLKRDGDGAHPYIQATLEAKIEDLVKLLDKINW